MCARSIVSAGKEIAIAAHELRRLAHWRQQRLKMKHSPAPGTIISMEICPKTPFLCMKGGHCSSFENDWRVVDAVITEGSRIGRGTQRGSTDLVTNYALKRRCDTYCDVANCNSSIYPHIA